MNVLSLFDGMSCGQIALNRSGLDYDNYFASEIDKHAIKVTQANYPETIQLGDVTGVEASRLPKIDLLIGGSPCQGFSFAGKQLAFDDPRSKLFFDYVRLLDKCNPKYFLLENVRMKKEYRDIISSYLGVEPIRINSNLVSAQNRDRYYWTNIPNIEQPEDKGILLRDIVHENADIDSVMSDTWYTWFKKNAEFQLKKSYSSLSPEKAITMTARQYANWNGNFIFESLKEYIVPFDKTLKILDKEVERGKIGCFNVNPSGKGMNGRVTSISSDKLPTLTTNKGEGQKISVSLKEYIVPFDKTLKILDKEVERGKIGCSNKGGQGDRVYYINGKSVTLCGEGGGRGCKTGLYLFGCITPDRVNKRQNGRRFNDGNKFYTLTAQDQHGVLVEGYIRKLTPIECERLQTVPDNYTNHVSKTQRYKMLGNGWTVDIISHIFKNIR